MKDNLFEKNEPKDDKANGNSDIWLDHDGAIQTGYLAKDTAPDTFVFSDRNGNPMLTLVENGDILIRGEYQATDKEVVDVLKKIVAEYMSTPKRRFY